MNNETVFLICTFIGLMFLMGSCTMLMNSTERIAASTECKDQCSQAFTSEEFRLKCFEDCPHYDIKGTTVTYNRTWVK